MKRITCLQADRIRALTDGVSSSLTNYVAGRVVDDRFPPHTATTWHIDGQDVLRETLDATGCCHWVIDVYAPTPVEDER